MIPVALTPSGRRPLDLDTLVLKKGSHRPPAREDVQPAGLCLMEAAAWMAGEGWGHTPRCVCSVISAAGMRLNDTLPDDLRQQLVPLLVPMLGTSGDGQRDARLRHLTQWMVQTVMPRWLEALGFPEMAHTARSHELKHDGDMELFFALNKFLGSLGDERRRRRAAVVGLMTWPQALGYAYLRAASTAASLALARLMYGQGASAISTIDSATGPWRMFLEVLQDGQEEVGHHRAEAHARSLFDPLVRELQVDAVKVFGEIVHMRPGGAS